jgi:hypothetical protein
MAEVWPMLDLGMQAEGVPAPVVRWGSRARTARVTGGTVHFYTDDYRFRALMAPGKAMDVPASGCAVAVEPNWSTAPPPRMARLEALLLIRRKRLLARSWQRMGLRILVDLNVDPAWADLSLMGVPLGWRAYATRWQRGMATADLRVQAQRARAHMLGAPTPPSDRNGGANTSPAPRTSNLSTQGPSVAPGPASSPPTDGPEQPTGPGPSPGTAQGPPEPLPGGVTPEVDGGPARGGGVPVKNSGQGLGLADSGQGFAVKNSGRDFEGGGLGQSLVGCRSGGLVFVVFGGRRRVREVCRLHGWMWCGEEMDVVRGRGM